MVTKLNIEPSGGRGTLYAWASALLEPILPRWNAFGLHYRLNSSERVLILAKREKEKFCTERLKQEAEANSIPHQNLRQTSQDFQWIQSFFVRYSAV